LGSVLVPSVAGRRIRRAATLADVDAEVGIAGRIDGRHAHAEPGSDRRPGVRPDQPLVWQRRVAAIDGKRHIEAGVLRVVVELRAGVELDKNGEPRLRRRGLIARDAHLLRPRVSSQVRHLDLD